MKMKRAVLLSDSGGAAARMIVPLVILALPAATATAFLHFVNKSGRHAPRATVVTIEASKVLDDSIRVNKLNKLLEEKRRELLSDTSKLQEQQPKSINATDNELRDALTTNQMVRETLLSTRFHMPFLHRTKIGQSNIEGAGRGLFATENIAKGEVITCYPGDCLLCEMPLQDENDDLHQNEEELFEADLDKEDDYVDGVVLWGAHVAHQERWDDDAVFDGTEFTPPLTSYVLSVDDAYSVMGLPSFDDNPAYYGHFANDGAGHMALEKPNSQNNIQAALELGLDREGGIGVEENIAAYVLKSFEVSNAMHLSPDERSSHMVTVATREILGGEEVLVTYGPDYWVGHA